MDTVVKSLVRSDSTSVQSDQSLPFHWNVFGVHDYQMSVQSRLRSVCLGTPERSVCVAVQLANRRKIHEEVQLNPGGDTPSICVAAYADLRICGGHVIL